MATLYTYGFQCITLKREIELEMFTTMTGGDAGRLLERHRGSDGGGCEGVARDRQRTWGLQERLRRDAEGRSALAGDP